MLFADSRREYPPCGGYSLLFFKAFEVMLDEFSFEKTEETPKDSQSFIKENLYEVLFSFTLVKLNDD